MDEVIELDKESRQTQQEADDLRASRNKISKEIGGLMKDGKKEEAEAKKAEVAAGAKRLAELEEKETELQEKITKIMMLIPQDGGSLRDGPILQRICGPSGRVRQPRCLLRKSRGNANAEV